MVVQIEEIRFRGHSQVRATHPRTIEVTRDGHLTPNGDCIVGVEADKGVADLSERFKMRICAGSRLRLTIKAGAGSFTFWAAGDPRLLLSSSKDLVIRKSEYICGRTLAVRAGAASIDIPRSIIASLRSPETHGSLLMEVEG